jgi:hypothetical protein
LVLPTEIQLCPDLQGYLRVKGEFPAAKISLNYVDHPILHEEFIAREMDPDPLRQKVEKLVETYSDPVLAGSEDVGLVGEGVMHRVGEKGIEVEKAVIGFL